MSAARLAVALLSSALLLGACVPKDAGYADVRRMVHERTRADVRHRQLDDADTSRELNDLLAKPLTDRDAVAVALLDNPDVQVAFEELGVARARLRHALRLPNPHAGAALRYHGSGSPELEIDAGIDLTQILYLPYREAIASNDLDAAKMDASGRVLDLVLAVRRAYYGHVADRQSVEMRRHVVQAASAAFEAAKRMHQAGNITDLELLTEQAQYDEARLAAARAEAAAGRSREQLSALLGTRARTASWRTLSRLPEPAAVDPDGSEADALRASLDLASLRYRYGAAGGRANLARIEGWLPAVKAGVSAERTDGEWGVGPMVEVEVPLFYQGQGNVAEAEAEWRRLERLHGSTALKIRSSVRAARVNLATTRAAALHYKKVLLPLRARIVEETQLGYNAMGVGVFQLLQARRDQVETGRAYVDALRDYWLAHAELQQLLRGRLVEVTPVAAAASASVGSASGGEAH